MSSIHPFEAAGLGLAPFSLTGTSVSVYSPCPGVSQPGGTCDYCGTGIKHLFHLRSSDGRASVVGSDCVAKLGRDDNQLVAAVRRAELQRDAEARAAKREVRWQKEQSRLLTELSEQRARNGGLTDREVAERQRETEAAELRELCLQRNAWYSMRNAWILPHLVGDGDFIRSIRSDLEHRVLVRELPPRAIAILQDLYAKGFGRRGSKAYSEAAAEFNRLVGE